MPGEQPRGAPPPTMTRDLPPCQVASGLGHPSQHPLQDHSPPNRTSQGLRETGSGVQSQESSEAQLRPVKVVESEALLLRAQALGDPSGKEGSPRAPPGKSHTQAHTWLAGRAKNSPPQLYSLSMVSLRAKPTMDEPHEDSQREGPQAPEVEDTQGRGSRSHHRLSLPRAEALPAPEELSSQRCFEEAPSSFTSTNYTSPSATPGPLPLRVPQNSGTSPHRPDSHPELQATGVEPWPPTVEDNFPGANFGVPSAEPKPFPEGSRPGSPQGVSFQYPFSAQAPQVVSNKSFTAHTVRHERATGALLFAFHQPLGTWPESTRNMGPAYPLPSRATPRPLPCYPSQPGGLEAPSKPEDTLSPTGAAHSAPSPFPDSLPKSLTKVLPEGPPAAHDGLRSPGRPPNPLPQRCFAGQNYGANGMGTSPGPLDTELQNPGPPPARLPQLWDPTAAPYPTPTLGPPATTRTTFFEDQPSPGQQLCLPQSSPLPWPPMFPSPGPNPHRTGVPRRLPFPGGAPEWQGGSQGVMGSNSMIAGPGEPLVAMRGGPGQPSSSPGLFNYGGLKDSESQPLFFGGTQSQVSPLGAPSLPPPRVVGASPSESPLPSPATNTTGSSTCSSLSPPSSSPANPSSEDSQLPSSLGASAFFHPPTHSQETSSPFPSPEPPHALHSHYQPEPAKAFPFPADGLGAEGTFECLEETPFPHDGPEMGRGGLQGLPRGPPPYFSLSSASLDQLDVLLTCRQCDRNYSSLAAFLEHRQFCSLLLARTKDGPQQAPGLSTPSSTPKAPADTDTGLLNHSQTVPFLLAGDIQTDGKDDPLRTSFLPGLATSSFPLPASDMDMEDDAKLDSLITEALNGMEYQSDNPEIDSSFIDVFADEEPSGPRGPSAGQPPNTRVGTTPENSAQPLLPARAATSEPQAPCPGDRDCPARNRPKTRSLGLAPRKAGATSLVRRQRRGKQLKLFQKELDIANSAKGSSRAISLRPRRRAQSTEQPPPRHGDLRSQAPKGPADLNLRATSLPTETRSSKHLRLPPGKGPRKRRARGGSWSKELIHKIVQQKNRLGAHNCASESEEDEGPRQQGSGFRGHSRHGRRRWHRGEKRKEKDLTQGPKKVVGQEAGEDRGSPTPREPCGPSQSLDAGKTPVERGLKCADHPTGAPRSPHQVPTHNAITPDENHPPLGFIQEAMKPEMTADLVLNTMKLRDMSGPPATHVRETPRPPKSNSRGDTGRPRPSESCAEVLTSGNAPTLSTDGVLGTSRCTKPHQAQDREDTPASQPEECLVPVTDTMDSSNPEPSILFFKNSDPGCDPAHFNRDSTGSTATKKESWPNNSTPRELFLRSKDLADCLTGHLYSKPFAGNPPPASLAQGNVESLEPKPTKVPPYAVETDTGRAQSPLTLESTSFFSGLPEDGFDPPLYDSLSTNRNTNVQLACADPVPKKPLIDPLCPSFLLLEEASPAMISRQFPDLSERKAFGEKCLCDGTVLPSPPPGPGRGSQCNIAFMSSDLCEDELEIKRLVTELENQLQRKEDTQGTPGECDEAICASRVGGIGPGPEPIPLPTLQAPSPHRVALSAADLTGLGGSSPKGEQALRSPQGHWPCQVTCSPVEAASHPSAQEDPVSGALYSPSGDLLGFQAVQHSSASQMERDTRVPLGGCLPDPNKQGEPLLDAESLVKGSPSCEPFFPENNETARTHKSIPLPSLCEQRRGHSPEPLKAKGPCQAPAALEAFGDPIVHVSPELVFQGHGDAPLGATLPPGASHSSASKGHSEGRTGEPKGAVPHTMAEEPGFEGEELAPAGASKLPAIQGGEARFHPTPNPAWLPHASPGRRPQDPVSNSLCSLQVLGTKAGSKEDTWDLQGPPSADAQSLQPRDPSDLGGVRMKGGSPERVQETPIPAMAGHKLGPKADGHLGSPSQAEKTKGEGEASRLRSGNQRSPGELDTRTKVITQLETPLARPAGGRDTCEGSRAALSHQEQVQPSPTSPEGDSLAVACSQEQPRDRIPEMTASSGLVPQLLLNEETPAASTGDMVTCAPSPTSPGTPTLCSLKPLPQEDSLSTSHSVIAAQGDPKELLPVPSSCGDPSSPQHWPAGPAWAPLGEASYIQAPTDAPPSLMTSLCGLEATLPHHPLLVASSPEDPPSGKPGLVDVLAPSRQGGDSPKDNTIRTPEDSRREELRGPPATAPPQGEDTSPRVTVQAADLPSVPTEEDTEAIRGLGIPDTHCRGVPLPTSPDGMSKDPSSDTLNNTPCLSHREGHSALAVLMDPATLQTAGPDTCLEGEASAGSEGQGDPGTPGARQAVVTKVPRASTQALTTSCSPTACHLSQDTSPSGSASDFKSDSPQSHISVPHQTPQKKPLGPQDPKQRPRGFKKKPKPMEKGQRKGQTPAGPPVTCEVCSASFCSSAGLSRHKARKHRHKEPTAQQSPEALPAVQSLEPMAQTCRATGKRSRKTPRKERSSHLPMGPGHPPGPSPIQGLVAPEDALGSETLKAARKGSRGPGTAGAPLNPQRHPPSQVQQGEHVRALASKPRKPGRLEAHRHHPKQTEKREGLKQGGEQADSHSNSEGKPNKRERKPRARRLREARGPQASADVTSDKHLLGPSPATGHHLVPLSHRLAPKGECGVDVGKPPHLAMLRPRMLDDMAEAGLGALCSEKSPQEWRIQGGRLEGALPGEQLDGWKEGLARCFGEPKALGVCREPSQAAGRQKAEDSSRTEGGSDEGSGERTLGLPVKSSSEAGSITGNCPQGLLATPEAGGGVQKPEGTITEAPSLGLGDPLSVFDDEVSFSQLFPLGGRLTQKKNPRVYGKRCKRPKRPPPSQPSSEVGGSTLLSSSRLPTDLSDSGSLCLSCEDPWDDEATGLPESFLMDGLLSTREPGFDLWAPSLSLWALEPSAEASCVGEVPSNCPEDEDEWSEAIPQLHMVPEAWRGLELRAPTDETSSSLGDVSPEPPNLEREHNDHHGLPRNAGLPPLHTKDFEVLSTQLEMQDLCFLGPCEDLVGLHRPSLFDFKATGTSQGQPSKRTEQAAEVGQAQGRDWPTKGRRTSYKCRVCFQRFHGLGELDLHKLAHSPSPPPICYMCVERRFGSRELLQEHLQEKHVQGKAGPWACGMCLKEVTDVWMYNQHLREHAARFARKGQARRSLEDLPGGLEGDSDITHSLNNVMEEAAAPHRGRHSVGRASQSPREVSEPEEEAEKETSRERLRPKVCIASLSQDGPLTPPALTGSSATRSGSAKTSPSPSPDPWSHSEPLLQAIPVHEDCKDPSRDCHHCGKQFPKPFKLQRHLVVHSPQRVYLCPRCPRVYPELCELQTHLGGEHGVKEERELPHTPLYTCELCANVMHVIRRSFICSSCNYTFAKKEQFDRHMDKHLRSGQQPFALRGVRRPGNPGQKAPVLEGMQPSKRRKVAAPSSPPGSSSMDRPESPGSPTLSEGSLQALPQLCSKDAPCITESWPQIQERPIDLVDHAVREDDPPSGSQELPPPSLSPSLAALAEDRDGLKLDGALERPEDGALPDSPRQCKQPAPLGGKRTPHLFSGKLRSSGAPGKYAPDHSLGDPSLLQKEKLVTTSHTVPGVGKGRRPHHKGGAAKPGFSQSLSKDKTSVSTPSKAPRIPAQLRKPVGIESPASGELPHSSEDRMKPTTLKAKQRPSSQGNGGPHLSTKTGGGSQPQPASGQLQSETATTPAKTSCPSQSPTPDQPLSRAQAKGCTKGPREAGDQRPRGCPDPREKRENSEKRRKAQALAPTRYESMGSLERTPLAPDKPPRAPRKQATPSRVLPVKPRPSSQSGKMRLQTADQRKDSGHTPRKEALGKAFPQARPLPRPPKRGRAVHGAEPAEPRGYRTAESQSDLLSQLFGQRLTSFKIPLKKDTSE
uniref:Zinc finger protein 469 n=1 Tax=Castor canadensis TaxID=51338 RepID=A0A8C0WVC1_CASCN|nr:zinc finger protein 469 [Castor canadensis]